MYVLSGVIADRVPSLTQSATHNVSSSFCVYKCNLVEVIT